MNSGIFSISGAPRLKQRHGDVEELNVVDFHSRRRSSDSLCSITCPKPTKAGVVSPQCSAPGMSPDSLDEPRPIPTKSTDFQTRSPITGTRSAFCPMSSTGGKTLLKRSGSRSDEFLKLDPAEPT